MEVGNAKAEGTLRSFKDAAWYSGFFLGAIASVGIDEYALAYVLLSLSLLTLLFQEWTRPEGKLSLSRKAFVTAIALCFFAAANLVGYNLQGNKPFSHLPNALAHLEILVNPPALSAVPRPWSPATDLPKSEPPKKPNNSRDLTERVFFRGLGMIHLDQDGILQLPFTFRIGGDHIQRLYGTFWSRAAEPFTYDAHKELQIENDFWSEFEQEIGKHSPPTYAASIVPETDNTANIVLGPDITAAMPTLERMSGRVFVAIRLQDEKRHVVLDRCVMVEVQTNQYALCSRHNDP